VAEKQLVPLEMGVFLQLFTKIFKGKDLKND